MHGRVAAKRGGARAGFHCFGVFPPGLAEVRVDVHHAGQCYQAFGLNHGGAVCCVGAGQVSAACGDNAVPDQEVFGRAAENRCAADEVCPGGGCILLIVCHQWLSLVE
ncbi:hypothetical protein D9M70_628100 [compost metagenome]